MSEADLVDQSLQCVSSVLQLVGIYFSIVSAYIAALFYFLGRAPFLMKALAFAFLSGALVFVGITSIAIERTTSGVVNALHALPDRVTLPPPTSLYFGLDSNVVLGLDVGVRAGWVMAVCIYLGLLYLTFLHRWSDYE